MPAKTRVGIVVSDKMNKTRTVEVRRSIRHPLYEKIIYFKKNFYAHDEKGVSKMGDEVLIQETRPLSRLKRWKVLRVLRSSYGPAKNLS